jgi:hypothetical protein
MVIFWGKNRFWTTLFEEKKNIQQIITLLKYISPNGKNSTQKKQKKKKLLPGR